MSGHRRDRVTELRAAITLVRSAAADIRWGEQPEVRVLPDGRLWLADLELAVSAADVYQAARGLVAAQLLGIAGETGKPLADVVAPWLVNLQTNEVMLDLDLSEPEDTVVRDDAA